jgi:hypothetical protein
MSKLKLNFLGQSSRSDSLKPIEDVLHEYGQEICEYAKGYFYYIVTTTSVYDDIKEASLYIIVPEIGYDYKILSINYFDIENVIVRYYTLKTNQIEESNIGIKNDWDSVRQKISELLSTTQAN